MEKQNILTQQDLIESAAACLRVWCGGNGHPIEAHMASDNLDAILNTSEKDLTNAELDDAEKGYLRDASQLLAECESICTQWDDEAWDRNKAYRLANALDLLAQGRK